VLEARAESTAQADKALYEKTCEFCVKKFFSENSYQNHLSSKKHKAREAQGVRRKTAAPDDASSVMSSTFSLGQPLPRKPGVDDEDEDDSDEVDTQAEEEFAEVVEGLQNASLSDSRPSPVKRPTNPRAVAAAAHVSPGPSESKNERGSGAVTPTPRDRNVFHSHRCFFCDYQSPTIPLNAHHMEKFHGMVIPERDYLVDLEGLLNHLWARIFEKHTCLTCGKEKRAAGEEKKKGQAVVDHMNDARHCTIPYSTEAEQLDIGEFYDFRSTYSSGEEDEDEEMGDGEAGGGAKLGAERSQTRMAEEGEEVDDEGWETDSSATSFDSDELTAVPADDRQRQYERLGKSSHHSHTDPRHHHMADGWHSHAHKHGHGAHAVFHDEYELHLPSGKSVGHRQWNRYYRQNLHNYPTPEERAERQAIEAARQDGEEMAVDSEEDSANQGPHGRELVLPRGHGGLVGVTNQNREKVRRSVLKSRTNEQAHAKNQDYARNKTLNNNERYYYRYTRGG
jgi:pre-60S factor REI1